MSSAKMNIVHGTHFYTRQCLHGRVKRLIILFLPPHNLPRKVWPFAIIYALWAGLLGPGSEYGLFALPAILVLQVFGHTYMYIYKINILIYIHS